MENREIAKIPKVPPLTTKAVKLLGSLCFRKNSIKIPSVDCLLIFGTAVSFKELAFSFEVLMKNTSAKKILVTGGKEEYPDARKHDLPESEMIFAEIKDFIPKKTDVILEKKSQNTYENLLFGLEMLERPIPSVCFVTKSFHSQRAYLTLKKFLGESKIFQSTYDPIYPSVGKKFCEQDWFEHPEYLSRVWGEFLRIRQYGTRGDLPLDEVKETIHEIEKETNDEKIP